MIQGQNRAIIFDLDGTLVDTARDIARSVNLTRQDYQLPELPLEQIIAYTGDGAAKLLERSFEGNQIDLDLGVRRMIGHYLEYPVVDSTLYPEVESGLSTLKKLGYRLAVLTNKPGKIARRILETLNISALFDEIVGGNEGFALKPDSEAAHYLLQRCHAVAKESWVLGDNHTDLFMASNAGMQGAFAEWGYGCVGTSMYKESFPDFNSFVTFQTENNS